MERGMEQGAKVAMLGLWLSPVTDDSTALSAHREKVPTKKIARPLIC